MHDAVGVVRLMVTSFLVAVSCSISKSAFILDRQVVACLLVDIVSVQIGLCGSVENS
jgi:hypothetical protein